MDRIEIYQEISSMQIAYIFHFVFYIIIGIEHFLIILKIFWQVKIYKKIFISFSIIDLIILFYPIIPLILMYRIILKKNLTTIFKYISLFITILSIIIGLILNIFFWFNLTATTNFFRECPYNLNDIGLFSKEENPPENCSKRRCILETINNDLEGYQYKYICNYNSQNEFEIEPDKQYPYKSSDNSFYNLNINIQCEVKTSIDELFIDKNNINEQNEIYIYLQKCWNNNFHEFYSCQRYESHEIFNINENYDCPKINYNIILYLFGIFLIILDIIFAFIPWSLDYKSYSRILSLVNNENDNQNSNLELENNDSNNQQRRRRNNETNTSSNNPNLNSVQNSNNQNGNGNNYQNNNLGNENNIINNENDYINQPTETIIIAKDKKASFNNSSNIKSYRLNSGENSKNNNSKSINNNKLKNKNRKKNYSNNVGSMISKTESQNMISRTSEKENESEDSNILNKKQLILNKVKKNNNNKNNNEIDDINFNNDIRYDEYKNNEEEDEKDSENKKVQDNCIIKNRNIIQNKNLLNNNNNKNNLLGNVEKEKIDNINIKETKNEMKKIDQNNLNGGSEKNKNKDNFENVQTIDQVDQINENINNNYRNKTPKKEIKTLKYNFSNVLTNLRDSDQITLFNNTNKSIIKEERKEEEKSNKEEEEEKNYYNISLEHKRHNLSSLTSFKIKNNSKVNKNKEEKKDNTIDNLKENQSSLLIDKSGNDSKFKEDIINPNHFINCSKK